MSLPSFSVRNSVLVNMLMIVLLVAGGIFAITLQREMFPESRPDKLLVSAIYPGVQPEDVEKAVTAPVKGVEVVELVRPAHEEPGGLAETIKGTISDAALSEPCFDLVPNRIVFDTVDNDVRVCVRLQHPQPNTSKMNDMKARCTGGDANRDLEVGKRKPRQLLVDEDK